MHAIAIRNFLLVASWLAAAPALAGVGGTSSGVTSTIGNQGTNASPEVQQQSAGFVEQNQQLTNAQNAVSPNGIVMPGGAVNAAGASGARGAANSASPESGGKPGDPNSASATPPAPPPPPPPPPTYVSVVKHLTPGSSSADPAGTTAGDPVVAIMPPAPPTTSLTQTKPDAPPPAKATPPAGVAPATAVANTEKPAEKIGASERAAEAGVVSGGRGPAPDGYTFYVGFGIALLLLVIAFGAYLSSQKDETARRSPS